MSLTKENILDIILGRIPLPASEADLMGIPGLDGVYQDGVEPSDGLRPDIPPDLSAAELIVAMNNSEFQDFKNQVARGERNVLDPPRPFWDAETKESAIHALGLDEEGLWWTDDAKNLVYHPEGILEGLGQVITSIPGGFFGGMEASNQVPSLGLKDKVKRAFSSDRKYPERDLLELYKKASEPSPSLLDILSPEEIAEHWNRMSSLEKHILSNSKIMMVNGRPVAFLKGTKIDPLIESSGGMKNYKLMQEGRPPSHIDQGRIELHHGGQMDNGIVFPLFQELHSVIPKNLTIGEIDRNAFAKYRSGFWKQGGGYYDP
ncbi:hypothetical protein Dalk_2645 [Desulfatibacillum aliphaticivorans]|uniref:LHH domain-containing protein n=2 Tax=Desulfatibacillum aliphaticivorans TaxID=218208 RepID=B8FIU7_DESAL|nr:hypothetical protein Dalk_2645 [Desulfatibacillum aliphaticivorans]